MRISGVIPLVNKDPNEEVGVHNRSVDQAAGIIAGTGTDLLARNPTGSAEFTLIGPVARSRDLAVAASRANLIKAMAARWPRQKP